MKILRNYNLHFSNEKMYGESFVILERRMQNISVHVTVILNQMRTENENIHP